MMKQFLALAALAAITLILGALAFAPSASAQDANVIPVSGDCYAIGEQLAQENGGTVAKAVPVTVDGQPMCKIVVLIPGAEGERPKRQEFTVPQ
jgi:hypothetical protein